MLPLINSQYISGRLRFFGASLDNKAVDKKVGHTSHARNEKMFKSSNIEKFENNRMVSICIFRSEHRPMKYLNSELRK